MTQKSEREVVAQHLMELRRAAVAALQLFDKIADQLSIYERYLALSNNYDVTLTGQFLVIKGGRSREATCINPDSKSEATATKDLGRSNEKENSYC
jgi:hypothetical protein